MGIFTDNPVLSKELRSRLRARKQGPGARVAAFLVTGLVVLLLYYYGMRAVLREPGQARDMYMIFVLLLLTIVIFMTPSLTAGAITQEREQQTWNALLLTRLRPDEIVLGKLLASLAPLAIILALFAPLNLFAALVGGVPFGVYLLSNLLLLATAVFYAVIGLCCSWAYRRTYVATSVSFAITMFFVIGTVLLLGLWTTARMGGVREQDFVPMWLNPYYAMTVVLEGWGRNFGSNRSWTPPIFNLFVYAAGTVILLLVVIRRLSRGPKELEQ